MKLVVIADDLTGALDSAVAFAEQGLKVLCALDQSHLSAAMDQDVDVVAVSTGSREIEQQEAVERVRTVLGIIRQSKGGKGLRLFKKVDSRLKGHVAAEIEALRHVGQDVLVCPAIPRLGRFVEKGMLCGAGVVTPRSVADIANVPLDNCPDARSQDDIAKALATFPADGLLVGAAGLAEGLAVQCTEHTGQRTPLRPRAPALFAIGSRDPVTLAQLDGFSPLPAPNGMVPPPASFTDAVQVIQMTPGESVISSHEAGANFAKGIADWISANRPATFLASGGESAAAICAHLDIGILQILGEILPGLPLSKSLNGQQDLFIITKSGGFGEPDTLVNLAAILVKHQ
ncbi:four-carbon acid sugar kinase family protein [uncultured Cohaesibacter sp.]|uniref:four-carbon acid sugar kinase family protein n=1 Tax=uncultured Cohaesibacter sp. TaxID=1002546 RepID=UPI0029C90ED7|nr:four-carbon acid sugar kinase family protein [uncultured Cohaesibacter sp.]